MEIEPIERSQRNHEEIGPIGRSKSDLEEIGPIGKSQNDPEEIGPIVMSQMELRNEPIGRQKTYSERRLQRASVILGIVTACLVVCWLPILFYNQVTTFCPACFVIDSRIVVSLSAVASSNSFMNIIIYSVKDRVFRNNLVSAFRCCRNN